MPLDKASGKKFLGLFNFFWWFVPSAVGILSPLTDHLKLVAKAFTMTNNAKKSFKLAKKALITAATLQHLRPDAWISLTSNASNTHIDRVLQQEEQRMWAQLGFFSWKLIGAELDYTTFNESSWGL